MAIATINPATGESVTLRNAFQPKLTATPTSTTTSTSSTSRRSG